MSKFYARLIIAAVSITVLLFAQPVDAGTAVPGDINSSSGYARESIMSLSMKNIISGDEKGNFNPSKPVTRGEMVKFIINALDIDTGNVPDTPTFTDVPKNHWAYKYVEAAYARGIVKGISDHSFGINNYCTREEIAVIISRTFEFFQASDAAKQVYPSLKRFSDNEKISGWARGGIEFSVFNTLMKGTGSAFDPKGYALREQIAVIVDRLLQRRAKTEELFEMANYTQVTRSNDGFIFTFSQPVDWITIDQIRDSSGKDTKENVPPPQLSYPYQYDFAGGYKRVEANYENLAAGKTYTVRYTFGVKDRKGEMAYGEKVVNIPENKLYIESAVPVNASYLKIKFSEETTADTAKDLRNYTVTDDGGNVLAIEQTIPSYNYVTLKLVKPLAGKKALAVNVKDVTARMSGNTFPTRSFSMVMEDRVSPSFSFESFNNGKNTTKLVLHFSEPVVDGAVKIDGKVLGHAEGESMILENLLLDGANNHIISIDGLSDGVNHIGCSSTLQSFLEPADGQKAGPAVVDASFVKDEAGNVTKIIVVYNKALKADAGYSGGAVDAFDAQNRSIKVENIVYDPFNNPIKTGIKLLCYTSEEVKTGAFEVVFPLADGIKLREGRYTFKFNSDLVCDTDGNPSQEASWVIDFSTAPRAVEKKQDSSTPAGQVPDESFGVPSDVEINLNGDIVRLSEQPVLYEGELFVPVSFFDKYYLESFYPSFNKSNNTYYIEMVETYPANNVKSLLVKSGTNKAYSGYFAGPGLPYDNEERYKDNLVVLSAAPHTVKGTLMVPAKSMVEALDGQFHWDMNSNTVYIREGMVKKYPELYYTLRKSFYYQYRGEIDSAVHMTAVGRKTKDSYLDLKMTTDRKFNLDNINISVNGSIEGKDMEEGDLRYEEIKISDKLYTKDFDKNQWYENSSTEGLWSVEAIAGRSERNQYGGINPYGELIADYSNYPFVNEGYTSIDGSSVVKYSAVLSSHDLKLLVPQKEYQAVNSLMDSVFKDSLNYTLELYLNDKSQVVKEVGKLTGIVRGDSEDVDLNIETVVDYRNIGSNIQILPPEGPGTHSSPKDVQAFTEIQVK